VQGAEAGFGPQSKLEAPRAAQGRTNSSTANKKGEIPQWIIAGLFSGDPGCLQCCDLIASIVDAMVWIVEVEAKEQKAHH
jgi:hypothetical protein